VLIPRFCAAIFYYCWLSFSLLHVNLNVNAQMGIQLVQYYILFSIDENPEASTWYAIGNSIGNASCEESPWSTNNGKFYLCPLSSLVIVTPGIIPAQQPVKLPNLFHI